MRADWREIDPHVVYLLAILTPVFCIPSWWWQVVVPLVPQGIVLTRTNDYFRVNRRPWTYLLTNELLVLGWTGLFIGLRVWTELPG